MKRKDYKRLAKISLKNRKSTTRSTVRGISFGLILLIPVIFVAIAIYTDLNRQTNKAPEYLFAQIDSPTARSPQKGNAAKDIIDTNNIIYSYEDAEKILNSKVASEAFVYEQVQFDFDYNNVSTENKQSGNKLFEFSVGSSGDLKPVYSVNNQIGNNQHSYNRIPNTFAAIMDNEKSDGIFNKKLDKLFNGVYLDGMYSGFTQGGKGQVILSELFLDSLGLKAEDVYGKMFSLKYNSDGNNSNIKIDNDNNPSNNTYSEITKYEFQNGTFSAFLCNEYEVVGIVKSDVTKFAIDALKIGYNNSDHLAANFMFFTTKSLIMEDGNVIEPVITKFESDEENYNSAYLATYSLNDSQIESLNQEYIALGVTSFSTQVNPYVYARNPDYHSRQTILLETANYKELDNQVKSLSKSLASYSEKVDQNYSIEYFVASSLYLELNSMYEAFIYIILILSVIGGIVFFAAIVNLFNSIVHSVDTRRNYLGVMRAIGAKSSVIPKLYFAESILIFKKALIWVIVFSSIICYGIKLLLDSAFSYINEQGVFPINLGVNLIYLPISIAIGVAVLILIGLGFSYSCSRKISKKPITEVLSAT